MCVCARVLGLFAFLAPHLSWEDERASKIDVYVASVSRHGSRGRSTFIIILSDTRSVAGGKWIEFAKDVFAEECDNNSSKHRLK